MIATRITILDKDGKKLGSLMLLKNEGVVFKMPEGAVTVHVHQETVDENTYPNALSDEVYSKIHKPEYGEMRCLLATVSTAEKPEEPNKKEHRGKHRTHKNKYRQ